MMCEPLSPSTIDVAAKLQALARRTGRAFRAVVNETLRRGLAITPPPRARQPFKVQVRDLGGLRPGIDLDNIAEILERVEGPTHR